MKFWVTKTSRTGELRDCPSGPHGTFQLSRELGGLSVLENLLAAQRRKLASRCSYIFFRPGKVRREEGANVERALEILQTYGLYALRDNRAKNSPEAEEVARDLACRDGVTKDFALDEPMAGVNPALIERIGGYILDLKHQV